MNKLINETAGIVNGVQNFKLDSVSEDLAAVDNVSRPNKDIMDEIKKEEEDRIREEKKNAAKNQVSEDNCRQQKEAIELRFMRAQERAHTERLKARTAENQKYQAGDIDTEDHKANLTKITEEYYQAIRKAEEERDKALENLQTANPRAYSKVCRGW